LVIAVSLCPQKIMDENIDQTLHDKCNDKLVRIQRGDETAFGELFCKACPKFISPCAPDYDEKPLKDYHQEARDLQLNMFMEEVRRLSLIPTVRSYLKLYTTIPISKLARFSDVDEATFRMHLLCYKHRTRTSGWCGGPVSSGDWISSSDVAFHVDKDMVHIADTEVARRYGEFFIRHINKFEQLISELKKA